MQTLRTEGNHEAERAIRAELMSAEQVRARKPGLAQRCFGFRHGPRGRRRLRFGVRRFGAAQQRLAIRSHQVQLDGRADVVDSLVQRISLRVAAGQIRRPGEEGAAAVVVDADSRVAEHGKPG